MALCGYDPYDWLLGHPQTTQYFGLVLTSMWVTLAAFVRVHQEPETATPPRRVASIAPVRRVGCGSCCFIASFVCALLSIVMSAGGYHGYYLAEEYSL